MSGCAVLLLGALSAVAPEQTRFRVTTRMVQVDVFVSRDGRPIAGLTADDFEVFDDGMAQRVELVDVETVPLDIAIVLDASSSVRGPRLSILKRAAHEFLDELSEIDRASVISFSHHVTRTSPLTNDISSLRAAIDGVEGDGATAWHDALYAGLKTVEDVPHRPMVLLFTDGADTYSWLDDDELQDVVRRSHAVLYAVAREDEGLTLTIDQNLLERQRAFRRNRSEHERRTRLRRELARATGGRLLETSSMDELERAFLDALSEMRTRYLLTYRPSGAVREGWHELEVNVKRRGAEVHARPGYFYEAPP